MAAAADAAAGGCDGLIENTIASTARVDYRRYILCLAFSYSEKPSFGGLFAGRISRQLPKIVIVNGHYVNINNDVLALIKRISDRSIYGRGGQ